MRASRQDGTYPRPQLVRPEWRSLDGDWEFAYDDQDQGSELRWYAPDASSADVFDRTIRVPFPPESPASGLNVTAFHPLVWYRRTLTPEDFPPAPEEGYRHLVHFGAVDFRVQVWCDGDVVGQHVGGQTPFDVDVTSQVAAGGVHLLVLRVADDPQDSAQPRGKQDWRPQPHGIWYHRTTGIWQSVWTETVPVLRLSELAWTADAVTGDVRCDVRLSTRPVAPVAIDIRLACNGSEVTRGRLVVSGIRATVDLNVGAPDGAGLDRRWTPENPTLFDATVRLRETSIRPALLDKVYSYFGIRSTTVGGGHFRLNGEARYLRSVLNQGYREATHLANKGTGELRSEVQLIKDLGFNAVRVHQKAEDPRFLFWCDRLGVMVWAETANAGAFSSDAVQLLTHEWLDLVRRDRSHPSIVSWVPTNESWGVKRMAVEPAQQAYAAALANLTRALDPTRPVLSNEGWEHVDSDIIGVHDYSSDPAMLASRYRDDEAAHHLVATVGAPGRRVVLNDEQRRRFERGDAPLMVTEFGGVSHTGKASGWGYASVQNDTEYTTVLRGLFDAIRSCPPIVGFCYTQLFDTALETNGLVRTDGTPKLPMAVLREIVTGQPEAALASAVPEPSGS